MPAGGLRIDPRTVPVLLEGSGTEEAAGGDPRMRSLDLVPFLPLEPLPRIPLPFDDEVSPEGSGVLDLSAASRRPCHSLHRLRRRIISFCFAVRGVVKGPSPSSSGSAGSERERLLAGGPDDAGSTEEDLDRGLSYFSVPLSLSSYT